MAHGQGTTNTHASAPRGAAQARARRLRPGTRVGGCEIIASVGGDICHHVYRARQLALGRVVALKVLTPKHPRWIERFLAEARLTASVAHPYINSVYGFGQDEPTGLHYMVLGWLGGGSLADLLRRRGRLEEVEALGIAEALAQALGALEQRGIVHRDLRPRSILFTHTGRPVLADLEHARYVSPLADNGALTPERPWSAEAYRYLPPEMIKDGAEADIRGDMYALGATLYHMLTGRAPHPGATKLQIVARLGREPLPHPRRLRPELSLASCQILARCLAYAPRERYQYSGHLRKHLRLVIERYEELACAAASIGAPSLLGTTSGAGPGARATSPAAREGLVTHRDAASPKPPPHQPRRRATEALIGRLAS